MFKLLMNCFNCMEEKKKKLKYFSFKNNSIKWNAHHKLTYMATTTKTKNTQNHGCRQTLSNEMKNKIVPSPCLSTPEYIVLKICILISH